MSCEACEEEQRAIESGDNPDTFTYVRIGNGNVLIVGCKRHLQQLINLIRVE